MTEPRAFDRARRAFATEWASLTEIGLTRDVQTQAQELLSAHVLRGMDALHLAGALWARAHLKSDLRFVCSDRRLGAAAREVGLEVEDPETD